MYLTVSVKNWTRKHKSCDLLDTPKQQETTEYGMKQSRDASFTMMSFSMNVTSGGALENLSPKQEKQEKMLKSVWIVSRKKLPKKLPKVFNLIQVYPDNLIESESRPSTMALTSMLAMLLFKQRRLKSHLILKKHSQAVT